MNICFPNSFIYGCIFHLTRSWYRKIQELGLSKVYKENCEEGSWLRKIFGLPYLEASEVGDCFVEELMSIQPNNDKIIKFTDYLVDTYITGDSIFPPSLWAEQTSRSHRTTNSCESFHSHFGQNFYESHPSIYKIFDVLYNYQTLI